MNKTTITLASCLAFTACGTAEQFETSNSSLSIYEVTDYDDQVHSVELIAHQPVTNGDIFETRIDGVLYHVDALDDRIEVSSNGAIVATALSVEAGVSLERAGQPPMFSPNSGAFHFGDDGAQAFGVPALMLMDHKLRDAIVLGELGPAANVAKLNISCCSGGLTISVTGKKGNTTSVTLKVTKKDEAAETESDGNTGSTSGGDASDGGTTSGGDESGGDSSEAPPSGGS